VSDCSTAVRRFRGEAAVALAAGDYAAVFLPELGMLGASLTWRGAELLSLHGGIAAYRRRSSTGMPLLAPWANRLSRSRFRVAGAAVDLRRQSVKRDPNGLPIHGTMTGRRSWEVVRAEPGRLVSRFRYDTVELLAAFPFPHELEVDARLAGTGLRVTTTLRPTGDRPVPVGFGWHPYFRAAGPRRGWALRVPARDHLRLDRRGIPTGRASAEPPERLPLADAALDDLYALARDRRFVLSGGGRDVEVRFDAGYPFAQLFAPPGRPFVAIEPMTAATNALVTGACPLVRPGERFAATFSVSAS
jgi:galactose mutarotase-like enzyme